MARVRSAVRALVLVAAVAIAAACGGDDGPVGLNPNLFRVDIVSGGGQTGFAGTVVEQPLVVQVRRKDTGAPEEGATVRWRVVSGSGEPTRSASATDETGRAATRVVLGEVEGEVVVEAEVLGLPAVTFPPLTALPAPTIRSLSVTSADPGDTIQIRVDNLPAGIGAEALFDGVAGTVVDRVDGTPTVLSAVVPPPAGVCSASVQQVDVRVRVGGLTTGPAALAVTVPPDPFRVGQVLVIEGTADVGCALLPADGGTAKYLLVALNAAFGDTLGSQLTLGGTSVSFGGPVRTPQAGPAAFDSRLRAFEQRLAARGVPAARPPSDSVRLFGGPSIGDTRQFWVLNDVGATDDGRLTEDEFDRVTAVLQFIGASTLVYVDRNAPDPGLSQADIEFLGETYDRRLYHVAVDFFGEPTDRDGNEQVIVLLTPVVNSLTPRDAEGVIVGFFFGLDLFDPNALGCPECQFSNGGELLYGLVPDPSGVFSDPRSRDRVMELLPGVMVHETQHMVDFRYKVFESNQVALERLWLSEALAHAAEELGGDAVDAAGDAQLADDLYASNFGRAARYLAAPDSFSLTLTTGQGSLGERGAWWLFLRWVAEQYGDFIFRDLTQSPDTGVSNVEARTGESFFRLFADWSVAMWADDLGIPGLASRYQVPKWQLRSILRVDPPGGGTPVYALQPRRETFASFRAGSITELVAAASPFYVELDAAGDTVPLQLQLTTTRAAGLAILRYQ
jgi:hypothetical protein